MAKPSLRKLQMPKNENDWGTLLSDIQANFDALRAAPRLDPATVGTIVVFILEADGTWHQWSVLAGAGVSFVENSVNRTLTLKAP